ncbi:hypothetical protein [Pandoraea oxalativorans]|uniref:hypothetical protein n=1 Tax=Pandoraea oxalativorans TaxID=573737 RepID=UPI0012F4DED1|nr:hypothetical protein [Pandoraea oxalativorans]
MNSSDGNGDAERKIQRHNDRKNISKKGFSRTYILANPLYGRFGKIPIKLFSDHCFHSHLLIININNKQFDHHIIQRDKSQKSAFRIFPLSEVAFDFTKSAVLKTHAFRHSRRFDHGDNPDCVI